MFSKFWQHISNTNIYRYIHIYILQNVHSLTLRPKGAQQPSNWHIFPKCWQHISNANIYITKCTFLGAQKPSNWHISLNCWYDIYNTNIYKYNWHVFLKSEYKYEYYKIYICIGYILPTIRKIYMSVGGFLFENVHFEITFCIGYKLPTFWE